MSLVIFWMAAAFVTYTYVLFPLILLLRGVFWRRPYRTADITPSVSMIIAAYNESTTIREKLNNTLALNYPRDQLQVLVASDGSSDDTEAIVSEFAQQGIELLSLPRRGKCQALNTAVAKATGEILVFSDANSMYAADAVRALVRPFADPTIGGVAGNQRYLDEHSSDGTGKGETAYWRFDQALKWLQSRAGSATSATGAIYAVRRSLYGEVPQGVMDDFVISTRVVAQGYRLVFAPEAVADEHVAKSHDIEFRRKVRITMGGLWGIVVMRQLLNPFRYGFYSLQLFTHKVLRRLVALVLVVLLLISPLVWAYGTFYQMATCAQLAFYGTGLAGFVIEQSRLTRLRVFSLPYYFCMVNFAVIYAIIKLLCGQRATLWETQRLGALDGGTLQTKRGVR